MNLKKYLAIGGKWQFVAVARGKQGPDPEVVLIAGKKVRGTNETCYLEWRENGKRRQLLAGKEPRQAKADWARKSDELDDRTADDSRNTPVNTAPATAAEPQADEPISTVVEQYLAGVKGTKSPATHEAYKVDLKWFEANLTQNTVASVRRADLLDLFAKGRDQKLAQASINRRVMVELMALRNAGSTVQLQKKDWPKVADSEIEVYTPGRDGDLLPCLQT